MKLLTPPSDITHLKRRQVIETWAFSMIDYALLTAKTQAEINVIQYLNLN